MKAARIVLKHKGLVLLDMPVRQILRLMRYQGDLGEQYLRLIPDYSTLVETHTDQFVQCEKWLSEEEEGEPV